MKLRETKPLLLWLFTPEDSASSPIESDTFHCGFQVKNPVGYSIAKVFVCYVAAVTVTLLLARLH